MHYIFFYQLTVKADDQLHHFAQTRETLLSFFDNQTVTYKGSMKSAVYLWSSLISPVTS